MKIKETRETANFSLKIAKYLMVVIIISILIFRHDYNDFGICNDYGNSLKCFMSCINPEKIFFRLIIMLIFGGHASILSSVLSAVVIFHKRSNEEEQKPYKKTAELSLILVGIYYVIIALHFILLYISTT